MNNLRLKSLELNGYKTFASQTRFEFAGSVTAIVGPNGSGKSNIADALRWVLGEQAYSILRGRKTEDMIFAGSEKRARAGMASATVTFDNSDGWLPIDFSEVSITRRAYRDGQNEYLINQQKVRLKDVNELLSQSALAERTYTVIGQGLVDTALTLNSDERRRLFEEAAGIGLYRTRKEQAQRRLEATQRNLDRVADILAELKPRVRSLERQSKRARDFSSLRTELRESLRSWYGYQWHRTQNDLSELRDEATSREEKLGLSRQKQSDLNNELNQLRNRSQELRTQLNEWHRRLAELHAGRESSSRELAVANERQRALAQQKLALDEERQRLSTELGALQVRMQETQKDESAAAKELQASGEKLAEAQNALNENLDSQKGATAQSSDLRESLARLKEQSAALQAESKELLSRQSNEATELTELEGMLRDIAEQITKAEEEQRLKQQALTEQETAVRALEASLEELHSAEEKLFEERRQFEAKQTNLQRSNARISAEIRGIEEANLAKAGFAQGAKSLLDAAKNKRIKLAQGTLGTALQVSEELEAAIAAALGDYLEAIFLTDSSYPEDALRLIEDEDASAALLPLKSLSPQKKLSFPRGKGVLGVAVDLVEVPGELQAALDLLLGQVLLVEDRATARRILPDLPQQSRVVTLRGEVFHRSGQIEVRSAKAATAISQPRKERKLREQLVESAKGLEKIDQQLAEQDARRLNMQQEQREQSQKMSSLAQTLEQTRGHVQTARLELEQLQNQQQWFKSQQRNLRRQTAESDERLALLKIEDQRQVEQITKAQQALETQPDETLELPLDEFRAQVAHWEMRVALGQRSAQDLQRRLTEHRQLIEKIEQQLAAEANRRQELEGQQQAIRTQKSQFDSGESQVDTEIASTQEKIGPAEEELGLAETQVQSLQSTERDAINNLSLAERGHTQAQISLARQQESLSTLRGRIEDDFGLVAFDYDKSVSGPTPLPLGDLVERLPVLETLDPDLEEKLKEQRAQLRRMGSINPEAQEEYASVKARYEDMQVQVADLEAAQNDLGEVITELDVLMEREFRKTFEQVAAEFRTIFSRLFQGGSARLLLIEGDDISKTGIDIEARLPGKRAQRLALLSGGERSLTATALVFSLLKASPTPFCVMDEVDAMLDEANIGRFTDLLRELSQETQFVLITHNRNTVQAAEVIYGITMGRDTASQVISLKLDEVDERYSR